MSRGHRFVEPVVHLPPQMVTRSVTVRLFPDEATELALGCTLVACNDAANALSAAAFAGQVLDKRTLQKAHCYDLREMFGLSSQLAVRVIGKVADAYKVGADVERSFRSFSAVPFDERILTWTLPDLPKVGDVPTTGSVSIRTVAGRIAGVPFHASAADMKTIIGHRKGESDLRFRDGKWLLTATVVELAVPAVEPTWFVGVDVGIVNVATTSAGSNFSGSKVNKYRRRQQRLRK